VGAGTQQPVLDGRRERVSRQVAKPPEERWVGEPDETTDALARVVLDAALEVHRHLGPAFLESVYKKPPGILLAAWRLGGSPY
jgi:hypothetical protein